MTTDEFLNHIARIVEVKKKREALNTQGKDTEYFAGYNDIVDKYERARIQAFGLFPQKMFESIAPMQSTEELEYIKQNYESETSDVFLEFTNTIKKGNVNGVIEYPKSETDESNKLQYYLQNELDNFDDIRDWADAMVAPKAIDANGIIAVWPSHIETDEDGVILGKIKPQPVIYSSPNVLWRNDDNEFIVFTSKTSVVRYYNKNEPVGLVFRYIGKDRYMEAHQVGDKKDDTFEVVLDFEHGIVSDQGIPFSPAKYLDGETMIIEDKVHRISVFDAAVRHLNLATLHASNELIILRKVGYPTRVVTLSDCKHQEQGGTCKDGLLSISDGLERKQITCPKCKGTGKNRVFGPMSELVLSEPDALDQNRSGTNANNAMAYVSPSIEIPKYLNELVQSKIDRAKEMLHLKSQARGSGDISATEKNRDKENTEAFVRPISTQIWANMRFVVECIGRLIYPDEYKDIKPDIIDPMNFDLFSAEDYVQLIADARESKMPSIIVQNLVYNYMQKIHKDSSLGMRVYELVENSDRLVASTQEEIVLGLSRGTVQKWEDVLHTSVFFIIHTLLRENDKFLMLETSEQIAQIHATAKSLVGSEVIDLPEPIEPG